MAWYDEAVFYHIYPLGLTGAPKKNSYEITEHRLNSLLPWISHIREIGCNALYIGPLFESVGHGYETTDYKKLDSRLGDNQDLKNFVSECHKQGIKVIFDGVFNHTGRDFFAFQDIKQNREQSPYKDWYCNVNFWGNNEYNDGFSYDNWGGHNLLVKLNQHNPAVKDYICDVIRFWVSEFDVDGIRLDAADVLDFDYMKTLRQVANEVKPEFWLMGEVIHGEYNRWVNQDMLHSVTNYHLHKALYSGHNDHNYFEIAHTVRRLYDMGQQQPNNFKLYNFVDNHDVERIYTKLREKAHMAPVHILLYTLPGIPSIYYGSEFGIEGKKERFSDDSLRPALYLDDFKDAMENNSITSLISKLGYAHQEVKPLCYGDYKELLLQNRQYAFSRNLDGQSVVVAVNCDTSDYVMTLPAGNASTYIGILSGEKVSVNGGNIVVNVRANFGDIWIPYMEETQSEEIQEESETMECQEFTEEIEEVVSSEIKEVSESEKEAKMTSKTEEVSKSEEETDITSKTEEVEETKTETEEDVEEAVEAVFEPEETKKDEDTSQTLEASCEKVKDSHEASATDQWTSQALFQAARNKAFEEGRITGLQEAILALMAKNGFVSDQMKQDVYRNVYPDSLIAWIQSFIR